MQRVGDFFFYFAFTFAIFSSVVSAEDSGELTAHLRDPALIEADMLSFDRPSNMAYGEGNVKIRYNDSVLRADRVRFNTSTHDVWADGNVRITRPREEWAGSSVFYNLDSRQIKSDQIRGVIDQIYVKVDDIRQVNSNQYSFATCTVTTCDLDQPDYRLQGTRGEIWPGEQVVLKNVSLRFGNVPVFWFPKVVWSLKDDHPPVAITLGHSSRSGFMILGSGYWRLNDELKLTIHLDERTRRGVGFGPDFDYQLGTRGGGQARGYYINDDVPFDDGDLLLGKNIPANRYRAQWQHKQELSDSIDLTVDINKLSDPDIIDDFFHKEFEQEREPDAVVDITHYGQSHTFSLFARTQINDFFAEVERLPELKLAVNRSRLGSTPIFYEGETSLGFLQNEAGDASDPSFTGHAVRGDSFHQIVLPQLWGGWLSFVPRAGVRGSYYSNAPDITADPDDVSRIVYNLGGEISFKISRIWRDATNENIQIDGIRHVVQPFVNYSWVPEPDRDPSELFQFDTQRTVILADGDELLLTRYLPLGFPSFNLVDDIEQQNTLRFGLRQKIQTRRSEASWNLLELTGWTDWRLEQLSDQNDFSELFAVLLLRPWEWFVLDTFSRYNFHDEVLNELNLSARILGNERWSMRVETRLLRNDSDLIGFGQTCRIGKNWTAHTYHRVDVADGQWEEHEYALRQELHDWFVSYGFRYRGQRVKDDEYDVFFAFTLKAFPNIGLAINKIDFNLEE